MRRPSPAFERVEPSHDSPTSSILPSAVLKCIQSAHRRDIQHAVGGRRGGADGFAEVYLAEELFVLAGGEGEEGAVAHVEVHLAVGDEAGGPDFAFAFVGPVGFAGGGVDAVDDAVAVGDEDEAVVDGGGGDYLAGGVGPELGAARRVAGLRGVDTLEPAVFLAPPEVAADGDEDLVV